MGEKVKLLFVVIGSFCLSLSIYELLTRSITALRLVFGMKQAPTARAAR